MDIITFASLYPREARRLVCSNLHHEVALKIWDLATWNELFEYFTA